MRYEYPHTLQVPEGKRAELALRLVAYRTHLKGLVAAKAYTTPETGIVAPFDADVLHDVLEIQKIYPDVRQVVVIGIGGSSLGAGAVFEALRTDASPELHILDVMDEEHLGATIEIVRANPLEESVIIVISKSGTTTETLANADVLINTLHRHFGNAFYRRVIVIGNPHTPLHAYAEKREMLFIPMPEPVGGRFSVFTAVGLVPLALLGVNVEALAKGAALGVTKGLEEGSDPVQSAIELAMLHDAGRRINVLFAEEARLHGFVAWYEQLLAESLGKRKASEKAGEKGNGKESETVGFLPVPMSPRELHSTVQLHLSGYPGTVTTFVQGARRESPYKLSEDECGALLSLGSLGYSRIPSAIMDGVQAAYAREGLPFLVFACDPTDPHSLGQIMAERMLEVMYIGNLWEINTFDQPHVELYKKETRRLLKE